MSELSVAEVLNRAADLIEPEGAWCQGHYARDAGGWSVDIGDPDACRFCIVGAVARVVGSLEEAEVILYEQGAAKLISPSSRTMSGFNDAANRTQAEVVSALRLAASTPPRVGEG